MTTLLAGACGGPSGTGIELTIEFGPGLSIDRVSLAGEVTGKGPLPVQTLPEKPRPLSPTGEKALLRFADEHAGLAVFLRVDGLFGETLVATGTLEAVLAAGTFVPATVVLGEPALCGDGRMRDGVEQCDDGNRVDGDGCSSLCRIEPGFRCDTPRGKLSHCQPDCRGTECPLTIRYRNRDVAEQSNQIMPDVKIENNEAADVPLSQLAVRYWYSAEGLAPGVTQEYACDFAARGCGTVSGSFVKLAVPVTGADHYLEVTFGSQAGTLAPNNEIELQSRFHKSDFSSYDETNDYSFAPPAPGYQYRNRITLYRQGVLIWGIEPP